MIRFRVPFTVTPRRVLRPLVAPMSRRLRWSRSASTATASAAALDPTAVLAARRPNRVESGRFIPSQASLGRTSLSHDVLVHRPEGAFGYRSPRISWYDERSTLAVGSIHPD